MSKLDDVVRIKQKANALFKNESYADAIEAYTEGVDALTTPIDLVNNMEAWEQGDGVYKESLILLAQLLNNRAQSWIKLRNFKQTLHDTATVIHICTATQRLFPKANPWKLVLRAAIEFQEMYVKAQLRRVTAYHAFGNTAMASEHLYAATCPPSVNSCYPPDVKLNIPKDAVEDFRRSLEMLHPDPTILATTPLDWSQIYAASWTELTATGNIPPATTYTATGVHNGKIYVACGKCLPYTIHNAVYCLNLSNMVWSKVAPRAGSGDAPPKVVTIASTLWGSRLVAYEGGPTVHTFDMPSETWQRIKASKPSTAVLRAAPFLAKHAMVTEQAIVVWQDKLYVFGGLMHSGSTYKNFNVLVACHLPTGVWEVVFDGKGLLSWEHPCPCQNVQMWAADNRIYVFGGRTLKNLNDAVDDYTLREEDYFWAFDLAKSRWSNEGNFLSATGASTNLPSSRSEVPALLVGRKVVVYGGYSTALSYLRNKRLLEKCVYLGDTFVYDLDTRQWRTVVSNKYPEGRAGAVLVHVPPPESSAAKSSNKPVAGKVFMLGGYRGGSSNVEYAMSKVWVLKVDNNTKKVVSLCHGCGKSCDGLRQCAGSCGGSVVVCGVDCHKKVWQEQHRSWCRKVEGQQGG